jgi:prolyl oligopeptidase PreP (S9A serine peptidase family)
VAYPATLVTTADTDDRVVPGHSFKYISALQQANPAATAPDPHRDAAGHGSGKPTDKQIEEYSTCTPSRRTSRGWTCRRGGRFSCLLLSAHPR